MYAVQRIYEVAQEPAPPPAMIYNLQPIPYAAFYRMVTRVSRSLAARGLKPGGVVVTWIYSLQVAWTAELALRSLGLTTVAIRDPGDLANLSGLDVVALVTLGPEGRAAALDAAAFPAAQRVALEASDWSGDGDEALAPPPTAPPGDHILLTSGTTGRFKMVLVEAAGEASNVRRAVERQQAQGRGGAGPRGMLNLLNFGLWTAAGYASPLAVWGVGATVIFHQGAEAWRSMTLPGITNATLTPAMLSQLIADAPPTIPRNDDLAISVTGGQLSFALAQQVKARLTNRLASSLGSTEAGAWATTPLDSADDVRWHRLNPARVVEVVDEAHAPLPPGQLGQVRVRLEAGFTGYLNDPEATAEFVRDGYFYPGDLGVLDGNGRLALYGRTTDVLSFMGDKVPAAPYEEALREALGLEGVCVLSEQDAAGVDQLHVVLETEAPIDEARLTQVAQANLTGFPQAHFHFISPLPRTETGKIQRFRLKQLLLQRRQAGG